MKNYVRFRDPKNDQEVKNAILEFQKTLTIEKCRKYIDHLKNVRILTRLIENCQELLF